MLNRIILLESRQRFLEDKIKSLEQDTGPVYLTLPVRVFDLFPVYQMKKGEYWLVILNNKHSQEGNVIKVSRDVMEELLEDKVVTISDYIMTDKIARRCFINKRWVWQLIN